MKRGVKTIADVVPGSAAHLILLALRAPGGMTRVQICDRFGDHPSGALHRLRALGLIDMPAESGNGKPIRLTDAARKLTAPDGPLARRKTLITYCQL